ncbi:uncharacterized protein FN964_001135 [Alca torda]
MDSVTTYTNYTLNFTMDMFTSPFTSYAKLSPSEPGEGSPPGIVNDSCVPKIMVLVLILTNGLQGWFLFKFWCKSWCSTIHATRTPSAPVQVAPVTRRKKKRSGSSSVPCDKDQVKPDSRGEDSSDEDQGTSSKDNRGEAPASAQEEESDTEVIVKSFSMKDLRNMRKDFTRNDGETLVSWLLRCWDNGADSMELDGSEARQLGNLAREGGIDKALGKKSQTLSLWRRLVSAVKGRYPFKDDIECRPTKWTNIEKGIKYLREMAVKEVIYGDWEVNVDPDEMPCRKPMLRKFVQSAPPMYSHTLSVLIWGGDDDDSLTVNEVASRMRQMEQRSYSPPVRTCVAAIRRRPHPPRPTQRKQNTLRNILWSCLCDYGEDMRTESVTISGVTGGSQELTVLEAEVSLTGNKWEKHPIITGPDAPCILGIDFLKRGYFKDPKGYRWAFGIAAVETEDITQLSTLPGLSDDPSVVGLLKVKEQQVPIATATVHRRQYRTNRDSLIPIQNLIRRLETQGVISKTRSPFNSPIWPVRKSDGDWRLTVDYRGLNEVTPPLSAAVPDMLELQYELESKAAKWYATIDIANAFFSIPLAAECRPQFAFTWRGVQYTWNRLPQGWKHSPTICHGLIQTALEKGGAPEHLQYIDDIIVWGNTAEEVFKKAGDNGPTWSLWQKAPGETRGRPLGFWSRGYRGSEANYTPTEKEILAAYEGVRAASEVIGTEAQLLLAPRLPVLGWMFKGKVPSTHHATDATWSKWVALITQRARIGNPNRPGIVEVITNWPEGKDSTMPPEEVVTRAEEAPPYNELSDNEKQCVLFTDGSCRIVGKHRKWKAAVWSPTRRVAEATEGEGESSQFAEVKAIQLALDIAEREKWPILYLYTDSWMVANALWGWLKQWKQSNWQRRGKPIWAAELWQDIAERLGKLVVKVRHVDAHIPMSRATEEHQNNQQVDKAAKIFQTDLDWEHKGELFLARWAHDTSGHQGRDATYKWARDRGVDLTMDAIAQVIHDCETCAEIKQAKRLKPLWYGGRWLKYKYGEAWQIDYITLPQTRQGKRYVLTMVEASTGWLETYAVPHATARNTILGLERQVLWRHGTPERIESDNGTHFKNNLISAWAKEHGIEWVYHIPYHAPASGKIERYNGLLKTTLKSMGGGTFKNWDKHLAQATWLVNTRGSINRAGPAQSDLLHNIEGDKVPVVHERNMLGKAVWVSPTAGKGKPIRGTFFAQGPGCTWWVMMENGEVQCVPQGNLTLGENTQL